MDARWSTSAAFLDYDRDGDLDLFAGQYVAFTMAGNKECNDPVGVRDYCAPAAWPPVPDRLLRNNGHGRFADVSELAGITRAYGPALGVAIGDLDADGWPDIYVANDAQPNPLWRNRHDGTFEDIGLLSGTAVNAGRRPEAAWASPWAIPTRWRRRHLREQSGWRVARLLRHRREGQLRRCARPRRAGRATVAMTGFGGWFDYDLDGRLDLFIANGAFNIVESLRGEAMPFRQRNQLFHNEGGGRFREVTSIAGPPSSCSR